MCIIRKHYSTATNTKQLFFLLFSADPPRDENPCQPSPCGPNSECRVKNGGAACSCLPGYKGAPPACRPECLLNTDCADHLACIGQKCLDPCSDQCGQGAKCSVISHNPVCRCNNGLIGDPYSICRAVPTSELQRNLLAYLIPGIPEAQRRDDKYST